MARTIKKGLGYFPMDVDFIQDIRIRKLVKYQGGRAIAVYALLLCIIYKNGYYAEWDKELPFIISEQTGFEEAYIQEVLNSCLNIGLLCKKLFESENILTSKGIQERYQAICYSNRRKGAVDKFSLLPPPEKTPPSVSGKRFTKVSRPTRDPASSKAARNRAPSTGRVIDVKPCPQKKEERKPSSASAPQQARLVYSATIEDEVAEMKKSAQWKEGVCIRYQLTNEQVDGYLADFVLKCNKQHTSLQDARSHFCYWLQGRLQGQTKEESQTQPPAGNDYEFKGGFGGVDI